MGAVFDNAPIQPAGVAVQVAKIHFDASYRYCRDGRRATTNISPVDPSGRPAGDLNGCSAHAKLLVEQARAKDLTVGMRD